MHVMIKDRIATRDNAVCVCRTVTYVAHIARASKQRGPTSNMGEGGGSKGMLLQKFLNSEYLSA